MVEDIVCSDLVINTELRCAMWWGAGEPVHISNLPRDAQTKVGPVRGLRFSNLICHSENGIVVYGGPQSPIQDVVFDNVENTIAKTSAIEGGFYDLRPGEQFSSLIRRKIAGFYVKSVSGLTLRDTSVVWGENPPAYYGPALDASHVSGLQLENFRGGGAHGKDPLQVINGKVAAEARGHS